MLWCGRFSVPSFSEIINIVPIVPKSVKVFSKNCSVYRRHQIEIIVRFRKIVLRADKLNWLIAARIRL